MSKPEGHRWFAAVYDRMSASMERGPVGQARVEVLRGLRGRVLEIGAGTGLNFPHYPPDVRVQATEPDPHMAKRARARLPANVELTDAPAEQLPFNDGTFDAVVSTLVLCTVEDVRASLREIARVLKPGGELRFLEHVRGGSVLGALQDVVQPVYGWMSGGCHANRRTEETLRAAGFEFIGIERRKLMPWLPAIIGRARLAHDVRVAIAATEAEREDAYRVRIAVFVGEQGIPREEELDELDATAVHCVGYVGGAPVAAGRLLIADGYGKVGRMAVLREHRGHGYGAAILDALEREATARGLPLIKLSAQLTARGFYDRVGYTAVGDVYDEVGIPHIAMEKRLGES